MQNNLSQQTKPRLSEFLIWAIIITLPVYLIKISILGLKTNLLDLLIVVLFAAFCIEAFHIEKNNRENTIKKTIFGAIPAPWLPTTFILVGVLMATIQSSDVLVSFGIVKSWFVLPVAFCLIVISIIRTDDQKKSIFKAWFVGGCLVAFISAIYYLGGELTYDGRLKGFFLSPNHLAMFLAPSFIISVFALVKDSKDNVGKNIFLAAAVILIGAIIFLTKSFGGVMAIIISLAPVFYWKIKNNKNTVGVFIVLFLLISGLLSLSAEKDFSERSSLSSRFMIWDSAIEILKDNIVFGIGPGTFQDKYLEYQYRFEPYLEWAVPQPHNIFLAFWLQTGVIGFVGFLWLLTVFFKTVYAQRNDKIVFLSGVIMIYFLIHGLIDSTYFKNDLAIMFWIVVAVSLPTIKTAPR